MPTVKVCVPVADRPTAKCTESLESLYREVATEQGGIIMTIDVMQSAYIYSSRNFLIGGTWEEEAALRESRRYDYYWFIDSDISGFNLDLLKSMIRADQLAVSVPYHDRNYPEKMVCGDFNFGLKDAPIMTNFSADTITRYRQCDWSGFGCVLLSNRIFRQLPFPWFQPEIIDYNYKGGYFREVVGEDVSFSKRMYFKGYPFHLIHHPLTHEK